MKNVQFYICPHCGNIVEMVHDAGVSIICCGQKIDLLVPNSVDASGEKHVPVAKVTGNVVEVEVGSVEHPMAEVHWIEWVALVSDKGIHRKHLNPGQAPKVSFHLADEKPLEIYAYCNLHGLWKAEI